MKRRKFLIGAGSLAAGSAAAMGTGAYNNASTSADSSINIVNDQTATLALDAHGQQVDMVDGQLKIDFGSHGVQPGSVYNLNAFTITNNDHVSHDVTITYKLDDYSGGSPPRANVFFTVTDGEGDTYGFQAKEQSSGDANTVTVPDVGSGEELSVKMRVDVKQQASTDDNLNGELHIKAN